MDKPVTPDSVQSDATQPVDRELLIYIDKDQWVEYVGTRAQLEAEGIIPDGAHWPGGTSKSYWQENGLHFELRRCIPPGMKGKVKLGGADYWHLSFKPVEHTYWDGVLKSKTRELNKLLFDHSAEGLRRFQDDLYRTDRARDDAAFQRFLTKIPALTETKLRRRGRKPTTSSEASND